MKTVAFMFGIVVYHLVPTSNHNWSSSMYKFGELYIILFLHQTTTLGFAPYGDSSLYIILFLHQTTTIYSEYRTKVGCISSCSYIKPQPTVMK